MTVASRASLPSASIVVRSTSSPRSALAATTWWLTLPMKRSTNQATQAMMATSRAASTWSRKGSSVWRCSTRAMKPRPTIHSATSSGRLADSTSASSQTVLVLAVARATWRSSTCATWLTIRVTSAMAISDATQSSMPMFWLRNSLSLIAWRRL